MSDSREEKQDTTMSTREGRINMAFIQATAALMKPYDVIDLLSTLMDACIDIFDVQAAGVLIADAVGELELVASTSEEAAIVETMIIDAGAGPCVDAFTSGTIISIASIGSEAHPWPAFRTAALEQGYQSTHAIPMRIRGETVGVMNLLGTSSRALEHGDVDLAQSLADIATLGIVHEKSFENPNSISDQFHLALDTRIMIEQAKGALALHGSLTMTEAFTALRNYARRNHQTLRHIAEGILAQQISPEMVVRINDVEGSAASAVG
jgi:transcriptional regulator with GAF, ATPase, and Fis domain